VQRRKLAAIRPAVKLNSVLVSVVTPFDWPDLWTIFS
jgi:hypothetical protein